MWRDNVHFTGKTGGKQIIVFLYQGRYQWLIELGTYIDCIPEPKLFCDIVNTILVLN